MNRVNYNPDEDRVLALANRISGVFARISTGEEDCGYQKADVMVTYGETLYPIQVSRQPKSKRELLRLATRGTFPVHTHKFVDMELDDSQIINQLEKIMQGDVQDD